MFDLTRNLLDVLSAHGIAPEESDLGSELPDVGRIEDEDTVYTTSLAQVFGNEISEDPVRRADFDPTDLRLSDWFRELEDLIERGRQSRPLRDYRSGREAVEPHCAWYCPVHYFGHGWGIYIRESCILSSALDLALFVDWSAVKISSHESARQLLRSSFYVFFLHEQFHHKVESFGFRLLVSTASDRYIRYKRQVYRPTYLTSDCLEESLANADSFRRLSEGRYKNRVDPAIFRGLKDYLRASIPLQPAGYKEGVEYFSERRYRQGLFELQSRIVDGSIQPSIPSTHWGAAPKMITSLADIAAEIYVVVPRGRRPLFNPGSVDPGFTASTRQIEGALISHYGYSRASGGKGSHVKLKKAGSPTIVLSGDRAVVSPGIVKQVLNALGGFPLSRLPDMLAGKL